MKKFLKSVAKIATLAFQIAIIIVLFFISVAIILPIILLIDWNNHEDFHHDDFVAAHIFDGSGNSA